MLTHNVYRYSRIFFYALLITVFSACSSGGGGGDSQAPAPKPLAAGSFVKTVDPDPSATQSFNGVFGIGPFRHFQLLYRAEDIGAAGYITALRFRRNVAYFNDITCPNNTIKLGHTATNSFDSAPADMTAHYDNGDGSLVTVIDDATIHIAAGPQDGYFEVPLSKNFYYNGVDNLIVDLVRNGVSCSDIADIVTEIPTISYNGITLSINALTPDTSSLTLAQLVAMRVAIKGGDESLDFGGSTGNAIPFNTGFSPRKIQLLYLASELNGNGPITGIGFPVAAGGSTTAQNYQVSIVMGHTSKDEFSLGTTYAENFDLDSPVTVANDAAFSVPDNINGNVVWLPLNGKAFSYNGSDNLIVQLTVTENMTVSNSIPWETSTFTGNRRVAGFDDVSGSTSNIVHQIIFRFNGGNMAVMTDTKSPTYFPFNGEDANTMQLFYAAQDLGTAAKITGLRLRLTSNSIPEEYTGFKVMMAGTDNDTLSMTLADNLNSPVTVYNGTFKVPAGLKSGDWVDIPISGFSYNPTKNLVIQISQQAGTGGLTNQTWTGQNTQASIGIAYPGSTTFDYGFYNNQHLQLQLKYTKY